MGNCEYTEDKETLTADKFSLNVGPINIKTDGSSKTCDTEKCNISNKLNSENNIDVNIDSEYIKLTKTITSLNTEYIKFGGTKYILGDDSIKIYKGCSHSYNSIENNNVELNLTLVTEGGISKSIIICIPLKESTNSNTNKSSTELNKIITEINNEIESQPDITSFSSTNNLDLSIILPKSGYYTYNVRSSDDNITDYIVFPPDNGITITPDNSIVVKNIITTCSKTIYLLPDDSNIELPVFYSNKPPVIGDKGSDDIYIDCKPVQTIDPDLGFKNIFYDIYETLPKSSIDRVIGTFLSYLFKFLFALLALFIIIKGPGLFFISPKKKTGVKTDNNPATVPQPDSADAAPAVAAVTAGNKHV